MARSTLTAGSLAFHPTVWVIFGRLEWTQGYLLNHRPRERKRLEAARALIQRECDSDSPDE
jgi:hypothetical protein